MILQDETVWLPLNRIAELFGTSKQNISYHLQNIYKKGELERDATVKEILTVQKEGDREVSRQLEYYNLDAIISVGYRVNSAQATRFRIWATKTLKEYLIKGFALDDERLKQGKTLFDKEYEKYRPIQDKAFEPDFDKLVEETKKKKRMSDSVSFKLKNDMNTLSELGMLPKEVAGEIVENLNPEFLLRPYQKDAFRDKKLNFNLSESGDEEKTLTFESIDLIRCYCKRVNRLLNMN